MAEGFYKTENMLKEKGFNVLTVANSECAKMTGACPAYLCGSEGKYLFWMLRFKLDEIKFVCTKWSLLIEPLSSCSSGAYRLPHAGSRKIAQLRLTPFLITLYRAALVFIVLLPILLWKGFAAVKTSSVRRRWQEGGWGYWRALRIHWP